MNYMQVITLRSTSQSGHIVRFACLLPSRPFLFASLKGLMTAAQAALRKLWNSQMAARELTDLGQAPISHMSCTA